MMLFALSRDGMAGVCGVWGEMGLPGDEDVEAEVAATIGGTLESCLLEELEERCNDMDIESDRAAFESRILWNRLRAAAVRRLDASAAEASAGVKRSFFCSSILINSEMFWSSSWTDAVFPTAVASAIRPDPGWFADEAALVLPLLPWSSSTFGAPPEESRARRWLKLLLYLVIGAGLGELDAEDVIAISAVFGTPFLVALAGTAGGGMPLASFRTPSTGARPTEGRGELETGGANDGEADNDGVLNGWNEIEPLRPIPALPSTPRSEEREFRFDRWPGIGRRGGKAVGESEPRSWAFRNAVMGLVPEAAPIWWKVERLP
jgi:hypothetical protein